MRLSPIVAFALLSSFAACVEPPDDEALGSTDEEIIGGTLASDWIVDRAVKPQYPCTATLIAPRYALTALHCTQYNTIGTTVHFYSVASGINQWLVRTVVAVYRRPGTSPAPTEDLWDITGRYADLAILKLDADAPIGTVPATLMWWYPGANQTGTVVGAGNHDSAGTNDDGELRMRDQTTRFADDDDGLIYTDEHDVNGGDSGGPLYQFRKVFGVLHGSSYTSVPEHLDWILTVLGYVWPYDAPQAAIYRIGTVMQSYGEATERMCQYSCQHSPCDAYNFAGSSCTLVKDVTGFVIAFNYRSALK